MITVQAVPSVGCAVGQAAFEVQSEPFAETAHCPAVQVATGSQPGTSAVPHSQVTPSWPQGEALAGGLVGQGDPEPPPASAVPESPCPPPLELPPSTPPLLLPPPLLLLPLLLLLPVPLLLAPPVLPPPSLLPPPSVPPSTVTPPLVNVDPPQAARQAAAIPSDAFLKLRCIATSTQARRAAAACMSAVYRETGARTAM